jgi:hypothetical protein
VAPGPTQPPPFTLSVVVQLLQVAVSNISLPGRTGIKLPTAIRFLDAHEQKVARSVFSSSLDFSRILITNGKGFGGSYFTIAIPVNGITYVVIMMGDVCSWAPNPALPNNGMSRTKILIHELTHAWQSQHHGSNPQAYMVNSVSCQAAAAALQGLSAYTPVPIYASAYAYVPDKPFTTYGVEQIAQQVEDNFSGRRSNPIIMKEIISVGPHVRSRPNEISSEVIGFEERSTPGVIWH